MRETSGASNFIRHWVRIRLQGYKPERCINQALDRGVRLRDVRPIDETEVQLCLAAADLRQLRKLAGSRYRITVQREGGSRVLVRRARGARLTAAGLALFLLVCGARTLFVRQIDVVGCRSIGEQEIRACIAEEGLYEGALRRFDCDAIEQKLYAAFPGIVWVRVAYAGSYVRVELAESRQVTAQEKDRETPCHVVAERDCYIERIYTYRGRAQVARDDFVRSGQVLISGIVPIEHPSYPVEADAQPEHYVHAEGKVTALVPYYFSFYMEPPEGEKAQRRQAQAVLRQWIKENVPEDAQILKKDFHFAVKKNIIRVYGTVETRQQVGVEKEIIVDKSESQSGTAEAPAGA